MKFQKIFWAFCAVSTLAVLPPQAYASEPPLWKDDLPSAVQATKEKQSLVLADFYAPWCYSCYFMAQNVLNQPELRSLRGKIEPVKIDVDSPQGARLKQERSVHFLPTYVMMNSDGREVGRIVGEQTRADFYTQLRRILSEHSTLDDLLAKLQAAVPAKKAELAKEILEIYQARGNTLDGLNFLDGLPEALRDDMLKIPAGARAAARLRLERAAQTKDGAACLSFGTELLKNDLDCSLPYDGKHINDCIKGMPAGSVKLMYQSEELQLNALIDKRILGREKDRCADFRSPVSFRVDLYRLEGRKIDAEALLNRVITLLRKELGDDLTRDRSKADNLRVFLELAHRDKELEALYPQLIIAYPDEYVYYYRLGKFLVQHNRATEALVRLEQAESKAYGANKLSVVEQKARALSQTGRKGDAIRILDEALSNHPDDFPDQIASLRRLKEELAR